MREHATERGFSLFELTVAMAILSVVLGTAFTLLNRFQQVYRTEEANAEAQRNGRFAIARLTEIIRSAGSNPTGKTAVNNWQFIQFANGNQGNWVRLRSDFNGDGDDNTAITANSDVLVTSEDVTLRLTGTTLELVDNTGAASANRQIVTVAENIASLSFRDPDAANSRREVVIELTSMPSGINQNDARYREAKFVSTVRLRNR